MRNPPDILDRLPHRAPFRFLSTLHEITPGHSGRAAWSVGGTEDFFAGHFPGDPIVPGVLLGEALAQLSGLVGLHVEGSPAGGAPVGGRLVHVEMRFDRAVRPPAEVELHSSLTRSFGTLRQFDVSATVAGQVVVRGSLTLAAVEGASA